jgi:hypothetical protein
MYTASFGDPDRVAVVGSSLRGGLITYLCYASVHTYLKTQDGLSCTHRCWLTVSESYSGERDFKNKTVTANRSIPPGGHSSLHVLIRRSAATHRLSDDNGRSRLENQLSRNKLGSAHVYVHGFSRCRLAVRSSFFESKIHLQSLNLLAVSKTVLKLGECIKTVPSQVLQVHIQSKLRILMMWTRYFGTTNTLSTGYPAWLIQQLAHSVVFNW